MKLNHRSLGLAVAIAVFVFALAVRLVGIGWGLKNDLHNASYHPDEPVNFGFSRQILPGRLKFVPEQPVAHFYSYGTLYLTLLRVASDITTTYTGGPKVQGDGWSWSNPDRTDWDWVSRCDMAGRLISAVAGAGTALVCFLLTRRFFGIAAGALAGLFIALAPAHVVHSRFQTVDVLATFFLACSLYFAVRMVYPSEDLRPHPGSGVGDGPSQGSSTAWLSSGTPSGVPERSGPDVAVTAADQSKATGTPGTAFAAGSAGDAGLTPDLIADNRQAVEDPGTGFAAFAAKGATQTPDGVADLSQAVEDPWTAPAADDDPGRGRRFDNEKLLLKNALLCGLFAGLSGGTKYTGVLALLSLLVAIFLAPTRKRIKLLLLGCLATGLAFFITTPGALLDTGNFMSDFAYEMQHTATGHGLVFVGTPSGFVFHALNLALGIGPILVVMGLGGLIWAAYRRHRWAFILLAFFVPYYLLIGKSEVKFVRYSFPLYVALAAGYGYAMVVSHRRGGWARGVTAVGILGLGGIPFGGLLGTVDFTAHMAGADARDQAADYLKSVSGNIGFVHTPWFWSPPLFLDSSDPVSIPWPVRQQKMAAALPPIVFVTDPNGNPTEWSSDLITVAKPDRIVCSSIEYDPVARLYGAKGFPSDTQGQIDQIDKFLDLLNGNYQLEKIFNAPLPMVEDLEYVRPTVYVWKRKTSR